MLTEAANDFCDAMLRSLPDPKDCNYEFSPRFERKMKRLIHRTNHPVTYRMLQRVASFALVVFIGFMMIFAISPTVRAAVLGWIREQYDSFIGYYFEDDSTGRTEPTAYYISNFPSDFSEITVSDNIGYHMEVYADSNGNLLYFFYSFSPENPSFYVEEEGSIIEHVTVSGNPADLYLSQDSMKTNSIIWCDEEHNVIFYLSAVMEKDDLLAIAESVLPKK